MGVERLIPIWRDKVGFAVSEERCTFVYSLVRMLRPVDVIAYGVAGDASLLAFCAQALSHNGVGQVTVYGSPDDRQLGLLGRLGLDVSSIIHVRPRSEFAPHSQEYDFGLFVGGAEHDLVDVVASCAGPVIAFLTPEQALELDGYPIDYRSTTMLFGSTPPEINSPDWWNGKTTRMIALGDSRDRKEEADDLAKYAIGPVLEVGCFVGCFSAHLGPDVEYVGIDVSESAIRQAKKRYPDRRFECADFMLDGSYSTVSYRTVCVFQLLEHFTDDELDEVMARLCTLGPERLLFSVPTGPITARGKLADGHFTTWPDEQAFVERFERFGRITFTYANKGHLCGVLDWGSA